MVARWACFTAGFWLVLAPLLLGHPSVGVVLHDVGAGTLACTLALASFPWPALRRAVVLPAAWLLAAPHLMAWGSALADANQRIAGAVLLVAALAPGPRPASRPAERPGMAA
jgi:hypothetical protein